MVARTAAPWKPEPRNLSTCTFRANPPRLVFDFTYTVAAHDINVELDMLGGGRRCSVVDTRGDPAYSSDDGRSSLHSFSARVGQRYIIRLE